MSFFKSFLGRLVAAGIGIVIVAVGVFVFSKAENAINGKEVGDCVSAVGSSSDAELDDKDCGDSDATYRVTSTDGDCDDYEVSYEETVNGGTTEELCLDYNAEKGDCFELGGTNSPDQKVECTPGANVFEVLLAADGADTACPKGTPKELVFPNQKRDTILCFKPAG